VNSARHLRARLIFVLLAAAATLLVAACGDGGQEKAPTSGATASPAPVASPAATPTNSGASASARYCQMSQAPLADWKVEITARWKGKDRIVIEGSATLPGPGTVNYWICQNGELATFLIKARQPTFEGGKISAESVIDESRGGTLDPDASFEAVVSILGDPIQIPFFAVRVPVEGKPG
jgi:hypothetical protein